MRKRLNHGFAVEVISVQIHYVAVLLVSVVVLHRRVVGLSVPVGNHRDASTQTLLYEEIHIVIRQQFQPHVCLF